MFLNDAYLGGLISNSPGTFKYHNVICKIPVYSHGLSIQCGLYTFFFPRNTMCVSSYKIANCAFKKKKRNGTGTDGRHSLTQFREIHEC